MTLSTILDLANQPIGAVVIFIVLWILYRIVLFLLWRLPKGAWVIATWKSSIENRLESLEEKVTDISDTLTDYFGKPVAKTQSPQSLTDYGISISESIDAEGIAKIFSEKISDDTKEMNAYEIQQYCFDYAKGQLLNELKNNYKNHYEKITSYAYQNGVDVEKVMRVIGIVLRDGVLNESGKVTSEIDEHDPKD